MAENKAGSEVRVLEDTLAKRYENMTSIRDPYLNRAQECSLLTLPSVFPPDGNSGSDTLYKPYQSIGARGVNNLANKLLLALLPPNSPFFKFSVDDKTLEELGDETARSKVEEKLNEIERTIMNYIENGNFRSPLITALKQLIVGGNALFLITKEERVRVIRLDSYVVRRDATGIVLEVIIKETSRYNDLPDDIQELIAAAGHNDDGDLNTKSIDIYTTYKLVDGKYVTYQTIKGIELPGTRGSYPKDRAPFIALRWGHTDNEDYGRSYVEEYIGDLQTSEGLSKAIVEASAAASKVVIVVNPNGLTQSADVSEAENLDVITGRLDDVGVLQLAKQADMVVAKDVLNEILTRVSYAFLMNTAVQRNAERVTAEEIRTMIQELEDALGGTYALFAQEFQLPFVRMIQAALVKKKRVPDLASLKKDGVDIEPQITTGVEAIGRGHDLNKLVTFMNTFVVPFADAGFAEINIADFLKRGGVSLGIDMDGLVKSQEQKQAEQQAAAQAQQEQLAQQTMADVAKQAAGPVVQAAVSGSE